jgi:hypothetical protein
MTVNCVFFIRLWSLLSYLYRKYRLDFFYSLYNNNFCNKYMEDLFLELSQFT